MKNNKIIFLMIICLSMLSSCGLNNRNSENTRDVEIIKNYFEKHNPEYEVLEKEASGTMHVSVEAPDFYKITEKMLRSDGNPEITISAIEKEIKNHPELMKEYSFWVDSEEVSTIKNELYKEISEDLIVNAIKNVEFTEEWSVEE